MTPEEKTKGNELIAKFMGMELSSTEHEEGTDHSWINSPDGEHWAFENPPHFDRSWNWIMPALAIAKRRIIDAGWGTPTEKEAKAKLKMALNEVSNINIENAHYCLVKFIEWFNINLEDPNANTVISNGIAMENHPGMKESEIVK